MCNAWNHHPSCACGWGGDGHLGVRTGGVSTMSFLGVPAIQHSIESYTNPNASCPVCGAAVFFYQSPNCGRVFFDELGPPWPKHSCTDNASNPTQLPQGAEARFGKLSASSYGWHKQGWKPFFVLMVESMDNGIVRLLGDIKGKYLSLYLVKILDPKTGKLALNSQSIVFVRHNSKQEVEVSYVNFSGESTNIQGFTKPWRARAKVPKIPRKIKKARRMDRKKEIQGEKDHTVKVPTAFELAYLKAKKSED